MCKKSDTPDNNFITKDTKDHIFLVWEFVSVDRLIESMVDLFTNLIFYSFTRITMQWMHCINLKKKLINYPMDL